MKRHIILWFSILCALCIGMPAHAQDDESANDDTEVKAPKKPTVKVPTYPTMEVKGIDRKSVCRERV